MVRRGSTVRVRQRAWRDPAWLLGLRDRRSWGEGSMTPAMETIWKRGEPSRSTTEGRLLSRRLSSTYGLTRTSLLSSVGGTGVWVAPPARLKRERERTHTPEACRLGTAALESHCDVLASARAHLRELRAGQPARRRLLQQLRRGARNDGSVARGPQDGHGAVLRRHRVDGARRVRPTRRRCARCWRATSSG